MADRPGTGGTADASRVQFRIFGGVVLLSLFAGLATDWYFLAGIPLVLLGAYLAVVDFRMLFFLLLFCIPLSTEVALPNGFGTDLPTEPLIIGLMLVYLLYVLKEGRRMSQDFFRHPLTLILLLHIGWIYITTITSDLVLVSVKFSLAKTWYLVTFYFMAGSLLKTRKDLELFFWTIFSSLFFTVLVVMVRHAAYGFSFADIHRVLHPFQRNHVNYAADIALFVPVVWLARGWYQRGTLTRDFLNAAIVIMLVALYFTYTRAAFISLFIAVGVYWVIQLRLMRYALAAAAVAGVAGAAYMVRHNNYLDYAPDYDKTITHTNFDNLLEATYKMEDISTMERVYRWVAAGHMVQAQPWMGYGPGNFVNFYKPYTVKSFRTYVSRNEELSGIHSYFLMTLVEQGAPGLLLFLLLSAAIFLYGERVYHRQTTPDGKRLVLMSILCLAVIYAFLLINDMIETDKVGSFFFLCTAILVNLDLKKNEGRQ